MSEIPTTLGLANLDLSREERMSAYLAMRTLGKVKGSKALAQATRVREDILGDCDVDAESGKVTWKAGVVALRDLEDLTLLRKQLEKLVDDEGVDIDLGRGVLGLKAKVDERYDECKAIERSTEAAKKVKTT